MTRRLKILLHGNCFDGAASASLFARFYAERVDDTAEIVYAPKSHARGTVFSDADFDADEHAVVDFRYAADDRLGWWFDHHASAFQPAGDEAHFRTRAADRFFYDASARSCTKFLAESLHASLGWDPAAYAELVRWADIIDGAQFESALQATRLTEPALQLMTFAEHNQDPALTRPFIEALVDRPLATLAAEPWVQALLAPVRRRNEHAEQVLRARVQLEHDVAFFDLGDDDVEGHNKFLPYLVAPAAKYLVAITASESKVKVSVGSNPWNRPRPLIHLARICERYGGGGHAVVGAITMSAGELPEARGIAAEITTELRGGGPPQKEP